MRSVRFLSAILAMSAFALPAQSEDQHHAKLDPRIFSAKFVYLEDQSHAPHVAEKALAQLEKWGRFQLVADRRKADLVILLSGDPYRGGQIATAGGQTGSVDEHGNIDLDPVPSFHKAAPVRYAYLTVIDARTREQLWNAEHQWGGLLTGFNSVGTRLVQKLEKQMRR